MDQNPPKESRPPINLRIKFRSESVEQFIERYAVDVSRGGIFIRTREPLAVGTQLKLDFQFQNGSALMAGDGTVVWIREFDANRTTVPPGMGVRFDKLTPESQAVLEQLLIEKAKRERSGIPGSGSQGAGGIAVRRPSSTFSVLDGQAGAASGSQPAAPANTGTATSSGAGAVQSGPLSPLAAVAAHAAARGAETTQKSEEPAAYRPLGTARNPFSSVAAPELPGSSTTTPSSNSSDVSEDSAAPFDDINDEPTQIAGRLPSFLLSDDDATVANAQAPGRASTAEDKTEGGVASKAGKNEGAGASRKGSAALAARAGLPGMGREPSAESGKRGSDDELSSNDEATASAAGDVNPASGAEAIAPADAAAAAKGATAAPSRGAAISETASASTRSTSDKRRSGAVLVAASVVVLGASGIFLFRFFSSQSTQTGQSTASSVGNPGTISAGPTPSPAPAGETQPAPAAGNAAGPDVPTAVPSSGGEAAPAAPQPGAAEATEHPSLPGAAAEPGANSPSLSAPLVADVSETNSRKPTKRKPARSTRDTASATPVGESKSGETKPGESKSGESKSGESKSGEGPSVAPPGATAAPAAPVVAGAAVPSGTPTAPGAAAKPEDKAAAAADTDVPGHQIRVTSKPDGADVTLDGQTVGKTPFVVGISDLTAPHIIAVRKDGFEPFEQMISATSAWSKPKPSKGKTTLQILKITVKLKPVAGAEARPATQPEPVTLDSANMNKGQPAKPVAPAKPASADSPLAPTEVRPAAESKP